METGGPAQPRPAGSRGPSRQLLTIGATAALALVAGIVLAAVMLSGRARPPGLASSSPSSEASGAATAGTSKPEPSTVASAIPYVADAPLLQVSVAGLRMRAAASTSAEVIRTFALGEVVRVQAGPVEADGFVWSEVMDLDSRSGWAAMGADELPWLVPVPSNPTTSQLLLRLERTCETSLRDVGIPVVPGDVVLTADGRVLLISGVVRQLSPAGMARVHDEVLSLPALQASGSYALEPRPDQPPAPGHGACIHRYTLGEGTQQIVVTATNWQGDQEESAYWLPAPERHALDDLATHLFDIEAWLGAAAWSEPRAHPYVSSSYLLWSERAGDTAAPETGAAPVAGAAWPFDGPVEQFGDLVGQARCGYLDPGQAFEMLRLMREAGVIAYGYGVDPPELSLGGFGSGNFTTSAGWFTFWLSPRSPDGYPECPA